MAPKVVPSVENSLGAFCQILIKPIKNDYLPLLGLSPVVKDYEQDS